MYIWYYFFSHVIVIMPLSLTIIFIHAKTTWVISSSRVNWLGKFFPRDYPVQNISPANKMKIYLSTHPNLNDKRVGLIVAEKNRPPQKCLRHFCGGYKKR